MTHFLGRLVERARGTAPRVEPIIAPRFAPTPVAEIATEHETSPSGRGAPQKTKATNGIREAVVRQEEPVTEAPRPRAAIREPEEREETVEAAPQTLLVPLPRPDNDEVAPRPNWTRESESLRRDVLPHVQSAAAPPLVRRANHQPRSTMARPSDRSGVSASSVTFPNESAANEPPIVRVTIGRIEVHAAPAPAAPARKPPARSQPKLTLDAYLKARKEGAR